MKILKQILPIHWLFCQMVKSRKNNWKFKGIAMSRIGLNSKVSSIQNKQRNFFLVQSRNVMLSFNSSSYRISEKLFFWPNMHMATIHALKFSSINSLLLVPLHALLLSYCPHTSRFSSRWHLRMSWPWWCSCHRLCVEGLLPMLQSLAWTEISTLFCGK